MMTNGLGERFFGRWRNLRMTRAVREVEEDAAAESITKHASPFCRRIFMF